MARDGNAEARVQHSILERLRLVAPQLMVFHVPNGGLLDDKDKGDEERRRAGARRKWQGVVAGVPDLVLIEPGGRVFLIEVKSPNGTLTAAQREFRDWAQTYQVPWVLARSSDDVMAALARWNIPTREAVFT